MFILFTISRLGSNPNSNQQMINLINDIYSHIHTHTCIPTMEYYSAIQNDEIFPFCNCLLIYLENSILNEVNQTDKCKYISLICGIYKIIQMNIYREQKQTQRHRKQTWYKQGEGRGYGPNQKYEINRYSILYIKIDK